MRLKNYLRPISSTPHAVRYLLGTFALVLLWGILGGFQRFLLFTFNNEAPQRRSYMSSAIAKVHTIFTTRKARLKACTRRPPAKPKQIGRYPMKSSACGSVKRRPAMN